MASIKPRTDPARRLRSDRTNRQKGRPSCRLRAAKLRTSCYRLSWRDLHRRPNAGFGLLHKPEITPPSNSNQSYYAALAIFTAALFALPTSAAFSQVDVEVGPGG